MRTLRQLLRQPWKTFAGVVLMTVASAILCVCVGQAMAVRATRQTLDGQFSTVAIPQEQENDPYLTVTEELLAWLEQSAEEYPDVIQSVSRHGLLSASIPELTPMNQVSEPYRADNLQWAQYDYYNTSDGQRPYEVTRDNLKFYTYRSYQPEPYNMPYSCAMLVITLEEVQDPEPVYSQGIPVEEELSQEDFLSPQAYMDYLAAAEVAYAQVGYTRRISGTVTQVLSLPEGYEDPVGRVARLTLSAATLEELEAVELEPGKQYIVYGMDYEDEHRKLMGRLNVEGESNSRFNQPYDPDALKMVSEEERAWYENFNVGNDRIHQQYAVYKSVMLFESEYLQLNAISMTLRSPADTLGYTPVRENGDGRLLELLPEEKTYTVYDAQGQPITLGAEEYAARYQIPTIAPLEGAAEEFLQSEQGQAWKAALERDQVNNHAFAVLGVDKLSYHGEFALQKARIVQGRDFTQQELEGNARVCILPEELAVANGISVGDTITLNLYQTDPSLPYQGQRAGSQTLAAPVASFYFDTTPITETAQYTVVGLCKGEAAFPDAMENPYAFSANTVFVPKASVQTPMEYANAIPFVTVVLKNGKIDQFHDLTRAAGYAGLFRYYDQGYSQIAENFHNYEALAKQVLTVGCALYAILLTVFLLLFPGSRRGAVGTMVSLGAGAWRRTGYVWLTGAGILVISAALGAGLGYLLWERVLQALQASAESAVALQAEPAVLGAVAGAQLLAALAACLLTACLVAVPKRRLGGR